MIRKLQNQINYRDNDKLHVINKTIRDFDYYQSEVSCSKYSRAHLMHLTYSKLHGL